MTKEERKEIEKFEDIFGNVPFKNIKKIQKYIQENYISRDEIKKALEINDEDIEKIFNNKQEVKQYFERKYEE